MTVDPTLALNINGRTLTHPVPLSRWRFLFSDGQTVDVIATRDDSTLRAWVIKQTGADRIEGVALVETLNDYTPEIPA